MSAPRRAPSSLLSILATPPPSVAIEIAPGRVTAVAVSGAGKATSVTRHATEVLPERAVVPALNAANVGDRAAVAQAIKKAVAALGVRARRAALVIPDPVAKVTIL